METYRSPTVKPRLGIKRYRTTIVIILTIVFAMVLRQISLIETSPILSRSAGLLRTIVYLALFSSWGISIRRRIMQVQVHNYLLHISYVLVFWLCLRTIKYYFVIDHIDLTRYLWYLYYIPMLLIGLISLFIALSMGKAEGYRLPKCTNLLYIPTLILMILVITNDYHQLVFIFSGDIWDEHNYRYGIVFWLVFLWLIICFVALIVIIFINSRVPKRRKVIWMPFIPVFVDIIYTILFINKNSLIHTIAGDMTIFHGISLIAIFELCIYHGLIQSNKDYDKFFYESGISGIIVDNDFNIFYKSKSAKDIAIETLKAAKSKFVDIDGNTRLSSISIVGGYAFWLEDVSEMTRLVSNLKEVGESLSENNELLQAELELKERQIAIEEKEKLYNKIMKDVGRQLDKLDKLLLKSEDKISARNKLKVLCILGAYIKRRSNLIILSEDSQMLLAKELEYCFRESSEAISECGIQCLFKRRCEGSVATRHGLLIYDLFQEAIDIVNLDIDAIIINLKINQGDIDLKLEISTSREDVSTKGLKGLEDLQELGGCISEEYEDGRLHVIIKIPKRGGLL